MTDLCACGIELPTEAAKQRHTTVCDLQGLPGCRVTVYHRGRKRVTDSHPAATPQPRAAASPPTTPACAPSTGQTRSA